MKNVWQQFPRVSKCVLALIVAPPDLIFFKNYHTNEKIITSAYGGVKLWKASRSLLKLEVKRRWRTVKKKERSEADEEQC